MHVFESGYLQNETTLKQETLGSCAYASIRSHGHQGRLETTKYMVSRNKIKVTKPEVNGCKGGPKMFSGMNLMKRRKHEHKN